MSALREPARQSLAPSPPMRNRCVVRSCAVSLLPRGDLIRQRAFPWTLRQVRREIRPAPPAVRGGTGIGGDNRFSQAVALGVIAVSARARAAVGVDSGLSFPVAGGSPSSSARCGARRCAMPRTGPWAATRSTPLRRSRHVRRWGSPPRRPCAWSATRAATRWTRSRCTSACITCRAL